VHRATNISNLALKHSTQNFREKFANKTTMYRKRSADFSKYYTKIDNLCICLDIIGLMSALFGDYDSNEWRLFIDGGVNGLKVVLLHISNVQSSIPVAHASNMKESHDSMKTLLMRIKYEEHN
jgi:hypothetical protein